MVVSKFTEHLEENALLTKNAKSVSLEDILPVEKTDDENSRVRSLSTSTTYADSNGDSLPPSFSPPQTPMFTKPKRPRWSFFGGTLKNK